MGDLRRFLQAIAILIVPLAIEMIFEHFTRRSVFEVFGGIGELTIRAGRPRCEGAFRSGITAGVFGATLLPLFLGLYNTIMRRIAIIGLISAAVITYTSNSSGPLIAFLSGIVGWLFWPWRRGMKTVRWGILAALVGLHVSMKVPVWFIISKMADLTGGDGWHRSYLIDQAIRHFPDWWLMGTSQTRDWMPTVLVDGQADLTDLYVSAGTGGGLIALVFLVLILVRCFRSLGQSIEQVRERAVEETAARPELLEAEKMLWCLGCALFAHVVTLFSVTYFDQMHVVWWGLLATISSATASVLAIGSRGRIEDESAEEEMTFGELSASTEPFAFRAGEL
jgi:hypothetical protein